jgi:hypothetical protein
MSGPGKRLPAFLIFEGPVQNIWTNQTPKATVSQSPMKTGLRLFWPRVEPRPQSR